MTEIEILSKLRSYYSCFDKDEEPYYHALSEGIKALSRRKGKWIKDRLVSTSGGTYGVIRCSLCEDYYQDFNREWNFCPNCGADMRGEEDG